MCQGEECKTECGDDAKDVTIGGYSAVFVGCLTWNASNCVEFVNKQLTTSLVAKHHQFLSVATPSKLRLAKVIISG